MNQFTSRPITAHRPHAVVIGSGFGGLAAAVRLGARGYRVTVLERLAEVGGRARVFRQDGFTFDAGPTIITAPHLFEELWALCGRKLSDDVELRAMDPFYRILFDDGAHLDCWASDEAMVAEIARIAPQDVAGYRNFMAYSAEVFRTGFLRLGHVPFGSFASMLGVAGDLFRLGAHRSVYSAVANYVEHPHVRFALSFHPLFVGGNPFSASAIYCLIAHLERLWGVHFAMGGTGALVRGLVRLIEGQNNQVRTNADVAEIVTVGRRATGVKLHSGETIDADVVVSNADAAWTYRHLLAKVPHKRWSDRKLRRSNYSMSLFVWYFGTRRRYDAVPHHTILVGPRYRDGVQDIFDRKVLPESPSLYLHRPTATDSTLAPPGCDSFYVLAPVPHLESGVDWATAAEPYRQLIEKILSEKMLPGLEHEIVSSRIMTPLDFRYDLLSVNGSGFGLEPTLTQSAWFRPHNRSEDVERLYLVGAGTHPGAGVPGVLSSARILDEVVPDAVDAGS